MRASDPPPPPPKWWRARADSFGFALQGIRYLVISQTHARLHLLATISVVAAGAGFGVSRLEWCALILATGGVWTAEAINTSIEALVDLVHPTWDRRAGTVKDLAAGAVLLAAFAAAAIGALVFYPYAVTALTK